MTSTVCRPAFMEPSLSPPLQRTPCNPPAEMDECTMSKLDKFNNLLGFWGIIPNIHKGVFSFAKYCEWERLQEDVKDTIDMMNDYIILNRDWWAAMCTPGELPNVERMWLLERLLPTMSIFDIRVFILPLYLQWREQNPMKKDRWTKMKMFIEAYTHVLTGL